MVDRDKAVTFRASDDELAMLRDLAEHAGQSVSDYLRQFIRRAHAETFGAKPPKPVKATKSKK